MAGFASVYRLFYETFEEKKGTPVENRVLQV